jgi:hypothetical protein
VAVNEKVLNRECHLALTFIRTWAHRYSFFIFRFLLRFSCRYTIARTSVCNGKLFCVLLQCFWIRHKGNIYEFHMPNLSLQRPILADSYSHCVGCKNIKGKDG